MVACGTAIVGHGLERRLDAVRSEAGDNDDKDSYSVPAGPKYPAGLLSMTLTLTAHIFDVRVSSPVWCECIQEY